MDNYPKNSDQILLALARIEERVSSIVQRLDISNGRLSRHDEKIEMIQHTLDQRKSAIEEIPKLGETIKTISAIQNEQKGASRIESALWGLGGSVLVGSVLYWIKK